MMPHERIYVAVDTNDVAKARGLVEALAGKVGGFKLGLEFFTSMFAQLMTLQGSKAEGLLLNLRQLFAAIGNDLFWDGKFADIPNTVAGATLGLSPLSPKFFNVHANCGCAENVESGPDAVAQAVKNKGNSKVLAVTVLTSFNDRWCMNMFHQRSETLVVEWAAYALEAGVDGLICSPADLEWLKRTLQLYDAPKMTPGIRPAWSEKGDQSRIMTPAKALQAGVTWMVIGRPITQCADGPVAAVERIVDEMAAVA